MDYLGGQDQQEHLQQLLDNIKQGVVDEQQIKTEQACPKDPTSLSNNCEQFTQCNVDDVYNPQSHQYSLNIQNQQLSEQTLN